MLFQLPRACRTFVAIHPANQWSWSEIFSNKANYLLEVLTWQNGYDAKKKAQMMASKPKMFVPDFMKQEKSELAKDTVGYDVDQIKDILARPRT